MPLDRTRCRPLLQSFDFTGLFIEELGWDTHKATHEIPLPGRSVRLEAIAHKRGFVAWHCPTAKGSIFPDAAARRRIEREATKAAHEHLIVFTEAGNSRQIWQWVRRDPGQPLRVREVEWTGGQSGEVILQKLDPLFVSFDEEETITLPEVIGRVRANVNERVTKKFYADFTKQHTAFLKFITGIPNQGDHEWYASVMLNRLMFVYFVQRKGFLDGDTDYLRNRLKLLKEKNKGDKFYSFYRYFLVKLFHQGLGGKAPRKPELEKLIGRVPYLNGGIFDVHQLESDYGDAIQIPDKAFEAIFDYFDRYQWHLDERPLRADNEINPDVLGLIFEKYINQKQMGAYYTKEDITEYISKSTIIPFIFDAARAKCKVAFENTNGPTIWDLLRENPDRYIYAAVLHGTDQKLPPEIAAGLDAAKPNLIERRQSWNKPAPADYALPTEIWREVVARRQRCEEVRRKLASGEIHEVNDFITLNLDLRQFAQDVIQNCEGPDLLMAFWNAISTITVLDPTGGSGAFIFAALNILEPLYEACLDRMEAFVAEWGEEGKKAHPNYHKKFTEVLTNVAAPAHPNRRYFVLKSIILNNLYAVDIMEEAVEICKLRLFLKLAAQVEPDAAKDNLGIEPLPDIDFNIRAGNTLVGYATYDEVKRAVTSGLDFDNAMGKIAVKAADLQQTFDKFRQLQTEGDGSVPAAHKLELQKRLKALEDELNSHLASEYGVKVDADSIRNPASPFNKWVKSHQPFHWFIQFYGILSGGGFDVIIGNPPYLDLKQLKGYVPRNYSTQPTKNLYSMVLERCDKLVNARQGYIVPISSTATEGYSELQRILLKRQLWFTSFDDRPAHLFDGLDKNTLSILLLSQKQSSPVILSSRLNRWNAEEREALFAKLQLHAAPKCPLPGCFARISSKQEFDIWGKLFAQPVSLASAFSKYGKATTYYSRKVNSFLQILDFVPEVRDGRGKLRPPSEFKEMNFADASHAAAAFCLFNSTLFRWFMDVVSDGSHLNRRETDLFPFDPRTAGKYLHEFVKLGKRLSADLKKHSFERKMTYSHDTLTVQCIIPKFSKSILDEIDTVLAGHYGFTAEELDFILNYDIKYRLGRSTEDE
jgi:hypothetical protein